MIHLSRLAFMLTTLLLFSSVVHAGWVDSSSSVEITQTPRAFDRVNRVLFSYVTITNPSSEDIADQVRLVITDASIPVLNADGTTDDGSPFMEITGGLAAGAKTTVRVDFKLKRGRLAFGTRLEKNSLLTVDAGPDQTVESVSYVSLKGTVEDPDGNNVSYHWSQTSGVNVVLHHPDQNTVSFVSPEVNATQTLVFELVVTNDAGTTGTDSVSISVEPEPEILTGVFVDAPVEGVFYETSSGLTGKTGADGDFQYRKDDMISFFVGDIKLGELKAEAVVSVLGLDQKEQAAVLLQTLDEDGNLNNGIQISDSTFASLQNVDISLTPIDVDDPLVVEQLKQITGKTIKLTATEALANAEKAYSLQLIKTFPFYRYYVGNLLGRVDVSQ